MKALCEAICKGFEAMDDHAIAAPGISARIKIQGAELISLQDDAGGEILWQAGPEWPRHAPVLFPIVGRLTGDTLRHDDQNYTLGQHGFARDSRFEWTERSEQRAALRLTDSTETRRSFPFPFVLDLIYAASNATLSVTTRVSNPGNGPLPCGVGAHPGFRWPLVDGVAKTDHVIVFDTQETGQARSVDGGLLGPDMTLPFDGRELALSEDLFAQDALVMPDVASRSVRYEARGTNGKAARALIVAWEGYKDLGIWSKPGGAPFVCVEPWYGMASSVGWDSAFIDKPGILVLAPGESRDLTWSVTVETP